MKVEKMIGKSTLIIIGNIWMVCSILIEGRLVLNLVMLILGLSMMWWGILR